MEEILKKVLYPGFKKSVVDFGFVKSVDESDDKKRVIITYEIPSSDDEVAQKLNDATVDAFKAEGIEASVNIIRPKKQRETSSRGVNKMPFVKSFVMVSSGKGGVGKSTTTVNLAIAMAMQGKRVGILDGDIYGPNIARMLGKQNEKPTVINETKVKPFENYGIKFISMANLLPDGQALMWRGAMLVKALEQFMSDVEWGELDVLVIDMPPGTGDAQMTMAQQVPVTAGVAVTTPQTVALDDARRSMNMFKKLHIPIAGVVENMSGFICPENNKEYDIFGKGGAEVLAKEYDTQVLAQIPIEMEIRQGGDEGKPIMIAYPSSQSSQRYLKAADKLISFIDKVLQEDLAGNEMIQPIYGVGSTPSACSMKG
ncbi:MAG: Mrp/NBP35 family ATP-binding protein [Epsilonproteobacteria bacterium]|nr:Mrp/NBP35 family ATP-binding protein [Campylobacterota bacterium]